jgi:hypothetical protein
MALEFVASCVGKRSCLRIGRGTWENAIWAARSPQRIEQRYPNAKVNADIDNVPASLKQILAVLELHSELANLPPP